MQKTLLFFILLIGFSVSYGQNMLTQPNPNNLPPQVRERTLPPLEAVTITHSNSQNITQFNSVSCNAGGLHTDNSYFRAFTLDDFGLTSGFDVTEVEIGVEQAIGAGGNQPIEVYLYTSTPAFPGGFPGSLTQIGHAAVNIPDMALDYFTIPVTGSAPAHTQLVVEIFTPNGQGAGHSFFIGSNEFGETDPSYLMAADCGVGAPTPTGAIGFPTMGIVMNVTGEEPFTGNAEITFVCDMTPMYVAGLFDPAKANNVYVRGNFNGWGTTPMTPIPSTVGEVKYEAVVPGIPLGTELEYKFFFDNPNTWENFHASEPNLQNGNRYYVVGDPPPPKSIGGSYVEYLGGQYLPGSTMDLPFNLHVELAGAEWMDDVDLTFPAGVTPNSATPIGSGAYPSGIPFGGIAGQVVSWVSTPSWGDITSNGDYGFSVNVTIDPAKFSGPMEIYWELWGDVFGDPPHYIDGTVTVDELLSEITLEHFFRNMSDYVDVNFTVDMIFEQEYDFDPDIHTVQVHPYRNGGWSYINMDPVAKFDEDKYHVMLENVGVRPNGVLPYKYDYWIPGDPSSTTWEEHVEPTPENPYGDRWYYVTGPDIAAGEIVFDQTWEDFVPPIASIDDSDLEDWLNKDMTSDHVKTLANDGDGDLEFAVAIDLGTPKAAHTPAKAASNKPVITAETQESKNVASNVIEEYPEWSPIKSSRFNKAGVVYDNGPFMTTPGAGAGGADISELQDASLGMGTYGFGFQISAGNSVADDFTVPAGQTWTVDDVYFYGYQTGSPTTPSPINEVYYQIYDGDPSAGGVVIFGDLATNQLIDSYWSGVYRVLESTPTNADRAIMEMHCAGGFALGEGTYWIEWQAGGSGSFSGPWIPPVTILGQGNTGNALQWTGSWAPAVDGGTGDPQGFPFIFEGPGGGGGGGWLSVDIPAGIVPPHSSQDLTFTYNTTGMDLGVYEAKVDCAMNDPYLQLVSFHAYLYLGANVMGTVIYTNGNVVPFVDITFTGDVPTKDGHMYEFTVPTDENGNFNVPVMPPATYDALLTGGYDVYEDVINIQDIVLSHNMAQNLAPKPELNTLQFWCADASMNNMIGTEDALLIQDFVFGGLVDELPRGQWITYPGALAITVDNQYSHDFGVIETIMPGDVNESYGFGWPFPGSVTITPDEKVQPIDEVITVPVYMKETQNLGAFALNLAYDSDNYEVQSFNSKLPNAKYSKDEGTLLVTGFMLDKSVKLTDGDELFSFTFKKKGDKEVDFFELQLLDSKSGIALNKDGDNINLKLSTLSFGDVIPTTYELSQNFPNPFNPTTKVSFSLPQADVVTLKIYDVLGAEVMTLVNGNKMEAGKYEMEIDASNLPSGAYIYRIVTNNFTATKKMMLLK